VSDCYDVAVVGGGLVGASFALALSSTELRVALIEAVAPETAGQPSFDERTTALGNGTRRIFEALGIWQEIASCACPIRTIHVSDAGRFGFARLKAQEQGIDAFGYVVPNRVLGAALWGRLRQTNMRIEVPATPETIEIGADEVSVRLRGRANLLHARLIVAADGAESRVRTAAAIDAKVEDYGQVALATTVRTDQPHRNVAYERFTQSGPIAVLPLQTGRLAVIWTLAPQLAAQVLGYGDKEFLAALQEALGWRAGKLLEAGRRAHYPLKLSRADETIANRSALIGNAAQALHPVAGQGFNLGLRDAAMLAELLASAAPGSDPGAPELLARFSQWRGQDRRGVIRFTDGLVKLFSDLRPGIRVVRDLGLLLFDVAPPAKSALARVSTGFGGPTPRLARGLPLNKRAATSGALS
jgi:2-octaprenyl-6-methoxyphenol hydroxylase